MRYRNRRTVRKMPKIYGNLQPRRRLLPWLGRALRFSSWTLALLVVVYAFTFSGWFRLHHVEVTGTYFTSAEKIKSLLPLGSNIFLFSDDQLRGQLLTNSVIQSVAIFRGLPDSLKVVVKERTPTLLWYSGSTVTLLDENGVAFWQYAQTDLPAITTPIGQLLAPVPKIYDTKALPVTLGEVIVSPMFIQFVQDSGKAFSQYLPSLTFDHWEVADTTYDLTLVTKQGLRAQLNTLGDAGVPMRNLARMLDQKKITITSQVDLRIDRWAFVQ